MPADQQAKVRLEAWARISLVVGLAAWLLAPAHGQDQSPTPNLKDTRVPPVAAERRDEPVATTRDESGSKPISPADAKKLEILRSGPRGIAHIFVDEPFSLIGGLAKHPHWTRQLELGSRSSTTWCAKPAD